ncbi:hypothetical protein RSAG8_10124, partial [Rhizoctonia solani AG-8 WAC10335]
MCSTISQLDLNCRWGTFHGCSSTHNIGFTRSWRIYTRSIGFRAGDSRAKSVGSSCTY